MAIAFDAASTAESATGLTLTWSHTCSGSDRFLAVAAAKYDTDTITGVTYNGDALSVLTGFPNESGEVWVLANPDAGTANIVVTWSGGSSSPNVGAAVSYTGVDQTTPYSNLAANNDNDSAEESVTVTSETGAVVLFGLLFSSEGAETISSVGAGQTARATSIYTSGGEFGVAFSDEPGAASVTGEYTMGGVPDYARHNWGVSLNAAGGGGGSGGPLVGGSLVRGGLTGRLVG